MKKAKVTINAKKPNETADIAEAIIAAMTGNAAFPTPDPTLASVTLKVGLVRDQVILIAGLVSDLAEARDLLKEHVLALKEDVFMLRDYVQAESDGNPALIHSAGMQIVGERTPVGPMTPVLNLQVSISDSEGTLDCVWSPIYGAMVYLVETAVAPEGPWTQVTAVTRASFTLTGLTPGNKYWVRVRAVGAAGLGPYSDPACKMAA